MVFLRSEKQQHGRQGLRVVVFGRAPAADLRNYAYDSGLQPGIPLLPDDGSLDVGVLTAKDLWEWSRAIGRVVIGQAHRSPLMRFTAGQHIDIRLNRKAPYELDGGERTPTRRLRIAVEPGAITVCVPEETSG